MAEQIVPPFSARNRSAQAQIDNDCPETTRRGLLHILIKLVNLEYVSGWTELSSELQRIARSEPEFRAVRAYEVSAEILTELPWERVFDFCERLCSHLAREVS